MKIGLLAPYSSQNHGTVLQAFALAKTIQNIGAECEYIRCGLYKPSRIGSRIWRILYPLLHPNYKRLLEQNRKQNKDDLSYAFLGLPEFKSILKKNEDFVRQYVPVSSKWTKVSKMGKQPYDRIIVGSDQTWNPDSLFQYSPFYLQHVKESSRKFSYACSMGRTYNFPQEYLDYLKTYLSSFTALSCRERQNCEMLEKLTGKRVSWVVDPTLLLSREQWLPYMKPVQMPDKYILCYILGERRCIGDYADELGRHKGLPVYYIMTRPSSCNHENVLKDVGATEFLWLVNNCEYLVTDSFHGCVFSINFKRNVMAFSKFEGFVFDNARIKDVLCSFGLDSHYMSDTNYREPEDIDYSQVQSILDLRRTFSFNYLQSIIL